MRDEAYDIRHKRVKNAHFAIEDLIHMLQKHAAKEHKSGGRIKRAMGGVGKVRKDQY